MRKTPKGKWACWLVVTPRMGWEWPLPITPSQEPLGILLNHYYSLHPHFTNRNSPKEPTLLPPGRSASRQQS